MRQITRKSSSRFVSGILVVWWLGVCGAIALQAQEIDFTRDVLPIFETHCIDCHGEDTQESGYRVDLKRIALRGGDLYPQLIAHGEPRSSPLYRILAGLESDLTMPPDGDRLSDAELKVIEDWLAAGTPWPDDADGADDENDSLWSLQPLTKPSIPQARSATGADFENPIDSFIQARLKPLELSLSPPAERRTLIRRVSLVLTGLPPIPEDVAAFVSDDQPDAYERLVERLLDSPQFGEHWARKWLDVVRFAESDGFETNHDRPNAWHYRDYVIESFNSDKPFAQFVMEQLAGDQLNADAATGFLVGGSHDIVKGEDADLGITQRLDELADMVNTTSTSFLGLTVGCARCHSHKFDPITQTDYYALQAVFTGVQHGERELQAAGGEEGRLLAEAKRVELSRLQNEIAGFRPPVTHRANVEKFTPRTIKWVRFFVEATNLYEPCLDELEVFRAEEPDVNVALASRGTKATSSGDYQGAEIHQLDHVNDGRYGNRFSWIADSQNNVWVSLEFPEPETVDRIVWSRDRGYDEVTHSDRLATSYRIEGSLDGENWELLVSCDDRWSQQLLDERQREPTGNPDDHGSLKNLVSLRERIEILEREIRSLLQTRRAYAGKFETPPPTFRLHRGDHRQPREEIAPAALSAFAGLPIPWNVTDNPSDPERRMALARWLADPSNPLPARVWVNRLWQGVFGTGIVATPSDFGMMGTPPTHPELLDWLASELRSRNDSTKEIVRLLVTSETFRQSSRPHAAGLREDAGSRWLWRFPPQRLDGEMIRDQLLWVSDSLDLTSGGPSYSLFEPNDNYARNWIPKTEFSSAESRRMIYAQKLRMEPDAIFSVFDIPDAGQVCPSRPRSTTPMQALNMFNSNFVLDQADRLAEKLERASPSPALSATISAAFEKILLREPDQDELAWGVVLAEKHGLAAVCRALLNTNEFLWIE